MSIIWLELCASQIFLKNITSVPSHGFLELFSIFARLKVTQGLTILKYSKAARLTQYISTFLINCC